MLLRGGIAREESGGEEGYLGRECSGREGTTTLRPAVEGRHQFALAAARGGVGRGNRLIGSSLSFLLPSWTGMG